MSFGTLIAEFNVPADAGASPHTVVVCDGPTTNASILFRANCVESAAASLMVVVAVTTSQAPTTQTPTTITSSGSVGTTGVQGRNGDTAPSGWLVALIGVVAVLAAAVVAVLVRRRREFPGPSQSVAVYVEIRDAPQLAVSAEAASDPAIHVVSLTLERSAVNEVEVTASTESLTRVVAFEEESVTTPSDTTR